MTYKTFTLNLDCFVPRNDGTRQRHCEQRAWEKSPAKKSDDDQVAVIARHEAIQKKY